MPDQLGSIRDAFVWTKWHLIQKCTFIKRSSDRLPHTMEKKSISRSILIDLQFRFLRNTWNIPSKAKLSPRKVLNASWDFCGHHMCNGLKIVSTVNLVKSSMNATALPTCPEISMVEKIVKSLLENYCLPYGPNSPARRESVQMAQKKQKSQCSILMCPSLKRRWETNIFNISEKSRRAL